MRRVLAVLLVVSCSSRYDEAPSETATASDAGVEASAVTDSGSSTSDASEDGGAPLLRNGGFEESTTGCAPGWTTQEASGTPVLDAGHSGNIACRVCSTYVDRTRYGILSFPAVPVGSGGQWIGEAYVQRSAETTYTSVAALEFTLSDGGTVEAVAIPTVADAGWSLAQVTAPTPPGAVSVAFKVGADGSPTGCVLVDDAKLSFAP